MQEEFRPDDICACVRDKYGLRLDAMWKLVNRRRTKRDWPDWCFFPTLEWVGAMTQMLRHPIQAGDVQDLLAVQTYGAWRVTKDAVRFDGAIYKELLASPAEGILPAQALMRLPSWCVYVETPGLAVLGRVCRGFFGRLDVAGEGPVLALAFVGTEYRRGDPGVGVTVPVRIAEGITVEESLNAAAEHVRTAGPAPLRDEMEVAVGMFARDSGLRQALSLLIYVCEKGFPRSGSPRLVGEGAHARRRGGERGWHLGAAPHPTVHEMGLETGERLPKAEPRERKAASGTRASPRPHVRRGHEHGYWTGPRNGERKLVVRWQPPCEVSLGREDGEPQSGRSARPKSAGTSRRRPPAPEKKDAA